MVTRGPLGWVIVLISALVLASCSSTQPTADPGSGPTDAGSGRGVHAEAGPATLLGPDAYAEMLDRGDRFVVNVHTPDEGQIAGTDAAIAFDTLNQRRAELPSDRTSGLAIYCMSGNMSRSAADTLSAMGYHDIVDLRGGMEAWQADGRVLQPSA